MQRLLRVGKKSCWSCWALGGCWQDSVFPVMRFQKWLVKFLNSKKNKYYGNFIKYAFVEAGSEQEDVDIQEI